MGNIGSHVDITSDGRCFVGMTSPLWSAVVERRRGATVRKKTAYF
jgi:hypothetical protein